MVGHPVPVDMLEEGHLLLLGTTGAGKTYTLRGLIEQLREGGRRVAAIDKLGNHWGLTLAADGAGPGLDFVIFGGKRAHVPMRPDQGAALGRLLAERPLAAIFDLSQWTADEQQAWVADFADTVFRLNEGPMHLALDEAQSWVPQGGGGTAFRSVLRLAEQGRGNGIRLMMAAQRLSRIDKSAAGMASVIIAMRQTGLADRKAIRDLVASEDFAFEKDLPSLPTGTGFVWDPLAGTIARVGFPVNRTFDSSRTPRHGDKPPAPIATTSALVEELRRALAPPAIERQRPDPEDLIPADPGEAYARGSAVGAALAERDDRIAALEAEVEKWRGQFRFRGKVLERTRTELAALKAMLDRVRAALGSEPADRAVVAPAAPAALPAPAAGDRAPAPRQASHPLAGKIVDRLTELAPAALTWAQVASMLGYSTTGGYFRAGKREALATGLLVEEGDFVRSSRAPTAPLDRQAAFVLWSGILPEPAPRIMLVLRDQAEMTKAALAQALGYSPSGGHFRKGLAHLRQNRVTIDSGDIVRLAPRLPGEAA